MTCSATLRASDQRMTEVSKLPDTASLPSGEIANARTGPPWPRNCACAAKGASRPRHRRTMASRIGVTIAASKGKNRSLAAAAGGLPIARACQCTYIDRYLQQEEVFMKSFLLG